MLMHDLFPRRCLRDCVWKNGFLECRKCGRTLAFRYTVDGVVKGGVAGAMAKYRSEIMRMSQDGSVQEQGDKYVAELTWEDIVGDAKNIVSSYVPVDVELPPEAPEEDEN